MSNFTTSQWVESNLTYQVLILYLQCDGNYDFLPSEFPFKLKQYMYNEFKTKSNAIRKTQ